jgi:hypothetical protein
MVKKKIMNVCHVFKLCIVIALTAIGTGFGLGKTVAVRNLLIAIRTVESNSKNEAVGDGGQSIGAYQIQYAYWKDSCISGRWAQCRNRQYAERVVRAYWQRYCPKALASGDFKTLARVHNGGPSGRLNPKTLGYWRKVHSAIQAKSN